jgi:cytochrome c oxidase cbb3-type subunit III
MSKVTDELRGHRFDGIEEYDNPLPRWWLGIFWVTIAFAIFYVPYVHLGEGNTIADEYAADMAKASEQMAAQQINWDDAELSAHCEGGEAWKAPAQANYALRCAACHRADGGGVVGPAFTDDAYIHGGGYKDIAEVITVGVPAKGMIAWGKQLKQDEIRDLTCLVRSFRGTVVDQPKAPQGAAAQ